MNAFSQAVYSEEPSILVGMANSSPMTGDADIVTVESRFGVFEFDRNLCIRLPKGLLGFSDFSEFGITPIPNETLAPLLLLQSIESADLTFVVRPYDTGTGLIEEKDIAEAFDALSIDVGVGSIVLLTTFHRTPQGLQQSVNLRAPLLIDSDSKQAWQYIFRNDRYDVRHMLG
ncbi:flagellar assembly protein FliW [Pelagibius sp. Alg239-R121]|uniref:flagellar assembly protein FliW n=1 Tax=Pelagibius sp. Alg239-R121 TaxID=2993448 RepID=UPI0024A78E67|nr:flagellar assembly protein FliW [Pelagibius sp. Alg239-R121]